MNSKTKVLSLDYTLSTARSRIIDTFLPVTGEYIAMSTLYSNKKVSMRNDTRIRSLITCDVLPLPNTDFEYLEIGNSI